MIYAIQGRGFIFKFNTNRLQVDQNGALRLIGNMIGILGSKNYIQKMKFLC